MNEVIQQDMTEITAQKISWQKLAGCSVLITGANGMIASYLVYVLLFLNGRQNLGIKVFGLVRNREKAEKHFAEFLQRADFCLLVQDVCQKFSFAENFDYIIHAASPASPQDFRQSPVRTIKANIVGAMNVLDFAVERKAKGVMFLSTREIYGQIDVAGHIAEDTYGIVDPLLVRSCYPESKRMTETLAAAYGSQYGLKVKIARIAHTYGPGISISDGRVVNDFLGNVLRGEDIVMNSDGSKILALTYLADMVSGIFLHLLDVDELVCNISSEKSILSVKELAVLLTEIFREKNISVKFKAISEAERQGYLKNDVPILSSQRIGGYGWKPMVGLEEGLKRTVAYLAACEQR